MTKREPQNRGTEVMPTSQTDLLHSLRKAKAKRRAITRLRRIVLARYQEGHRKQGELDRELAQRLQREA